MGEFLQDIRWRLILYLVILIGMIALSFWAGIPWYWGIIIGVIGIICQTLSRWIPFFD